MACLQSGTCVHSWARMWWMWLLGQAGIPKLETRRSCTAQSDTLNTFHGSLEHHDCHLHLQHWQWLSPSAPGGVLYLDNKQVSRSSTNSIYVKVMASCYMWMVLALDDWKMHIANTTSRAIDRKGNWWVGLLLWDVGVGKSSERLISINTHEAGRKGDAEACQYKHW